MLQWSFTGGRDRCFAISLNKKGKTKMYQHRSNKSILCNNGEPRLGSQTFTHTVI